MAPEEQANAPDSDADKQKSSASTAAAEPNLINTPECSNCGDDAAYLIWIDGHGYTPYCRVCAAAAYDQFRDRSDAPIHYADLTQTRAIAGFCRQCGPAPHAKTVRVTDPRDTILVGCHECGGRAVIAPETTDDGLTLKYTPTDEEA